MRSKIISVWIFIFWLYLLNFNASLIIWVILIIFSLYAFPQKNILKWFKELYKKINQSSTESNNNFWLNIDINIREILNNSELQVFFEKHKKNLYKSKTHKEFIEEIIENFKKKYHKRDTDLTKIGKEYYYVKFNIKNNNIYQNWQIKFEDNIYDSIFIPYNLEAEEKFNTIWTWVSIRLLVVNWLLKLQIWRFTDWVIDNIIHTEKLWNDEYHTYKEYYDIAIFPLRYFTFLNLPKKYWNIEASGIEWYYLKENKEWVPERQELHRDLGKYQHLQSFWEDDQLDNQAWDIINEFNIKKERILKENSFESDNNNDDYFTQQHRWHIEEFNNKFMKINIVDYNDRIERTYKKSSSNYEKQEYYP